MRKSIQRRSAADKARAERKEEDEIVIVDSSSCIRSLSMGEVVSRQVSYVNENVAVAVFLLQ